MGKVGVVLVHGIGNIKNSEILSSAVLGIKRAFPKAKFEPIEDVKVSNKANEDKVKVCKTSVTGGSISLYEFHWKDVYNRITLASPLQSIFQFCSVLGDATLLCINKRTPVLNSFVYFFYAYFLISTFLICVSPSSLLLNGNPFAKTIYFDGFNTLVSTAPAVIFLADSAFLVIVTILLVLGFVGSTFTSYSFSRVQKFATLMIYLLLFHGSFGYGVASLNKLGALLLSKHYAYHVPYFPDFKLSVNFQYILVLIYGACIWSFIKFTNYLSDVVHYLAPCLKGEERDHQKTIKACLIKTINQIKNENFTDIVLVTHSLGTVIAIDALLSMSKKNFTNSEFNIFLITSGSPLRRLIYQLLPCREGTLKEVATTLSRAGSYTLAKWVNIFRVGDLVGQALTFTYIFKVFRPESKFSSDINGITLHEILITPRFKRPVSHSDYWSDPRFVDIISAHVIVPEVEPSREVVMGSVS
jgi:hypothetical protein